MSAANQDNFNKSLQTLECFFSQFGQDIFAKILLEVVVEKILEEKPSQEKQDS